MYRLQKLTRQATAGWAKIDLLLLPTAGTIYTIEQVEADPIQLNANLGYYTNFVNLMNLCAMAVPCATGPHTRDPVDTISCYTASNTCD
jgi:allophanate hydrolase